MGVTDFINPKDLTKPVHQVLYQFHNEKNISNYIKKLVLTKILTISQKMIREITGGGVDYSFECTGNVDVLREAFLSTHAVSPK